MFQLRIIRKQRTITFSYHDNEQLNKIIDIIKLNY